MYEGPFDFRLLLPEQLANLFPPAPVRTTSEPPVPGIQRPSAIPLPTEVPSPTPVTTIPAAPGTIKPVGVPTLRPGPGVVPLPMAAQPSEGPYPAAAVVPPAAAAAAAKKDDPFYQRALDWANSQQGKTSLAALAKGAGGNNVPAAPAVHFPRTSGGSAGGGVEGQLGNLRSQGGNMIAELIKQGRGKLGGGKRPRASDRYDILERGGR